VLKAGGKEKNWWPRLCRPTPPAVPAQDDWSEVLHSDDNRPVRLKEFGAEVLQIHVDNTVVKKEM